MLRRRTFRAPSRNDVPVGWFLRYLVPTVHVDVSPRTFVWRRRSREVAVRTTIFLDASGEVIVGFGEPPQSGASALVIELFPDRPDGHADIRDDLLEKYLGF